MNLAPRTVVARVVAPLRSIWERLDWDPVVATARASSMHCLLRAWGPAGSCQRGRQLPIRKAQSSYHPLTIMNAYRVPNLHKQDQELVAGEETAFSVLYILLVIVTYFLKVE